MWVKYVQKKTKSIFSWLKTIKDLKAIFNHVIVPTLKVLRRLRPRFDEIPWDLLSPVVV